MKEPDAARNVKPPRPFREFAKQYPGVTAAYERLGEEVRALVGERGEPLAGHQRALGAARELVERGPRGGGQTVRPVRWERALEASPSRFNPVCNVFLSHAAAHPASDPESCPGGVNIHLTYAPSRAYRHAPKPPDPARLAY